MLAEIVDVITKAAVVRSATPLHLLLGDALEDSIPARSACAGGAITGCDKRYGRTARAHRGGFQPLSTPHRMLSAAECGEQHTRGCGAGVPTCSPHNAACGGTGSPVAHLAIEVIGRAAAIPAETPLLCLGPGA